MNVTAVSDARAQLAGRIIVATAKARDLLRERNKFAHGRWEHEPFANPIIVMTNRQGPAPQRHEVTRADLASLGNRLQGSVFELRALLADLHAEAATATSPWVPPQPSKP